jgi:hypothetical protein
VDERRPVAGRRGTVRRADGVFQPARRLQPACAVPPVPSQSIWAGVVSLTRAHTGASCNDHGRSAPGLRTGQQADLRDMFVRLCR